MRYTKGKKGPESTNEVDIQYINKTGTEANPMSKGVGMVTTRNGVRSVSLIAQGRNARDLENAFETKGSTLRLVMRWTGRDSVTVTGIAA